VWYLSSASGRARPTANLGVTLIGVIWIGVLGSYAALIVDIPSQGVSLLLVAVIAAVATDVGGFFFGRAMGRSPLSAISPNKTVEGLVGGIAVTIFAVFVFVVVLGVSSLSAGKALVLAVVLAIVAPLGDLAESQFKRDLGLKDMGSMLPEHGGLLDRFDALLFVLPTTYYVVRILGLG
ncbi:MAG: phosphatidate cytidylyltransferase, partial [Acidimicrobiia bacterium]|nr:phosphatidate cytidylyltransferase [Acidimicrobiia bacterium]